MEILKSWRVQDFVTHLSDEATFGTRDVLQGVGFKPSFSSYHVLNEMQCVKKVHQGGVRPNGVPDRNVYIKLPDGQYCPGCRYGESGSGGCVIKQKDIRRLFEENQ